MVAELKNALKKVEKLSKEKQKAIAEMILDEVKWELSFQNSQSQLSGLAEEAIHEYKLKKTKPLKLN